MCILLLYIVINSVLPKYTILPYCLALKWSGNERIWDIYDGHVSVNNCKCYKTIPKVAIHTVYHQHTNTLHMTIIYWILKHILNYLPCVIKQTKNGYRKVWLHESINREIWHNILLVILRHIRASREKVRLLVPYFKY